TLRRLSRPNKLRSASWKTPKIPAHQTSPARSRFVEPASIYMTATSSRPGMPSRRTARLVRSCPWLFTCSPPISTNSSHRSGESAFLDVVVYRLNQKDRPLLSVSTRFAAEAPAVGSEVFTVGYPMGWGPTMAFGRIGNVNTFLQTVETRLLQADLSACSGNSG